MLFSRGLWRVAASAPSSSFRASLGASWRGPLCAAAKFSSSTTGTGSSKPPQSIAELARSIDTTLSPEQKAYVDTLRKQIRGGPNTPRSLYRDVPRPEEVTGVGNFLPQIADDAEALIDFALSHIPRKAGPRRSREKQRRRLKFVAKKKQDDLRKEQTVAAKLKHDQKLKKSRALVRHYKEEGARLALIRANTSMVK